MKNPPPFDLQKAMAGEPLVCRDSDRYEPTYGTFNAKAEDDEQLVCWIKHKVTGTVGCYTFFSNGVFAEGEESGFDLFMAPKTETRTGWVNIYRCGVRPIPTGAFETEKQPTGVYETEELAREMARLNPEGYLGTSVVTWEE